MWPLFADLEDPELQKLATLLTETVLKSRAISTSKKYLSAFNRWRSWADSHNIWVLPVEDKCLALYLQFLGESCHLKAAAEEIVQAVSWLHATAGLPSPTNNPFIKTVLDGLRRTLAKPTVKKTPLSIEILRAMVEDTKENMSLSNVLPVF